jgi:DNA-binding FrmR family transcriptional regulator
MLEKMQAVRAAMDRYMVDVLSRQSRKCITVLLHERYEVAIGMESEEVDRPTAVAT